MKKINISIILFTLIALCIILFYKNDSYLGIYDNVMYIEYDFNFEDYEWTYEIDNEKIISVENISNSKWKITPQSNGNCRITFTYKNGDETKYKIYYDLKVKEKKIYWTQGEGSGLLDYPNPY